MFGFALDLWRVSASIESRNRGRLTDGAKGRLHLLVSAIQNATKKLLCILLPTLSVMKDRNNLLL